MTTKTDLQTIGLELRELATSPEREEGAIRDKIKEARRLIEETRESFEEAQEAHEFLGHLESLIANIESNALKALERQKEAS